MPFVNVIDGDGNAIFSSSGHVSDPSRNRFGHAAFLDLIPFLEDMFGPLDNVEYYNAPSRWAIYKRIMELSG